MTGFTARELSVKREEQQRMKGLFRSKYTLFLTFGLMAALCVYLNLTAVAHDKHMSGCVFMIDMRNHDIIDIFVELIEAINIFSFLDKIKFNLGCTP